MGKRGRPPHFKLNRVCTVLEKTEYELSHTLGLSIAALKAIDRNDAPLYLQLALTGLMTEMKPDALFTERNYTSDLFPGSELKLAG